MLCYLGWLKRSYYNYGWLQSKYALEGYWKNTILDRKTYPTFFQALLLKYDILSDRYIKIS